MKNKGIMALLLVILLVVSAIGVALLQRVNALEAAMEGMEFKHSMARLEIESLYSARYRLEDTFKAEGVALFERD